MTKIYHTTKWKKLRWQALRRDRFKCVACGTSLQGKGKARVDHIATVKSAPHLAFDLANLRSLCPSCDNKRHKEKASSAERDDGVDHNGMPTNPEHPWNK